MEILIQMVPVTPDVSLFIYGFNEKGEMIFRSSAMPKYLQNETIVIDKDIVYTNLYHFHIQYLKYFIE